MDDLERKHFMKTLAVFKCYKNYALNKVKKQALIYDKLSENHKALIPDFLFNISKIKQCIENNNKFIDFILANSKGEIFEEENPLTQRDETIENGDQGDAGVKTRFSITNMDVERINSVLKQFVRDWSSLGEIERKQSYEPVVNEIKQIFSPSDRKLSDIKILVPGAGLGRLAWELANAGFSCQGNEWSLYMLLPAYFILNFPFQTTVFRRYTWDCVATVYFIDTAHNILEYLDTIWNILVPGGYWINFGPLLYHFADIPGEDSIELAYADLKKAINLKGFELVKEELNIHSSFTQDPNSMLHYHYKCVFNVFRKPLLKSN
ncbi:unnamed protein product [Rodentolepis nana]|uniref:carnosine N-methyltransferase n=1 Tax=Rodentolepis nana TaxID=102285 RepID=A0A0R3T550_RODNA|nr:unnamed protein product [Rodentolepis nana]